MSKPKPQPVKAPFEQQQQQVNTYAPMSVAGTPEGRAFLSEPLDFGDPIDVDPGVRQRTDLAEQEAEYRNNSAFNLGTPKIIRDANRAKELRDIRGQGAAEAAQANYANQIGNNALRRDKTIAKVGRLERLLPQVFQTGGSGTSSGFNTQVLQPQGGGFLSSFGAGLGSSLGSAVPFL